MGPRARLPSTTAHQKGGRIAKELKTLINDDKEKAHRTRFEEVVQQRKTDQELTQRIYTCVSNKLLSDKQREEDPEFSSKITLLDKVPKVFVKQFLDSLLPHDSLSASACKVATNSSSADLPYDLLCLVCRVEKKDYIGPSLKQDWLALFKARHSECGNLFKQFATEFTNPRKFFQNYGHYKFLPAFQGQAAADQHNSTSVACCGLTAPLPKSVRVTASWTIKDNYSLEDATICDDDDFSFRAADCFKEVDGWAELRNTAWLTVYDKRGKNNSGENVGASAAGGAIADAPEDADNGSIPGEPELSDLDDLGSDDEVAEARPTKRAKTTEQGQTPMPKQRAPPASTPDKLNLILKAMLGATIPDVSAGKAVGEACVLQGDGVRST